MNAIHRITEYAVAGKRLGRHVDHHAHAAARPFAGPRQAITSVTWPRNIPILDQGDVGSCTGNAMTGALGTGPLYASLPIGHPSLTEAEALALYSAAEVIDGSGPYPPNDDGSTGPSVARAAENAGLIAGSRTFTDIDSVLQALMLGPVIVGVNWYSSFDNPGADGTVAISKSAYVRGGHEIVARVVDAPGQVIGLDNSWGTSFGVEGSFKMSFGTLTRLLAEQGDCTAFTPLGPPAPPAPTPTPTPTPTPAPRPPKPDWWDGFVAWLEKFWA
jgi:hypothetical protein